MEDLSKDIFPTGGAVVGMALVIAGLLASFAPVVIATSRGKAMPTLVCLILTIAAGVILVSTPTVFGAIQALLVWLAAVVIGSAAYVAYMISAALKVRKPVPSSREPRIEPRRAL